MNKQALHRTNNHLIMCTSILSCTVINIFPTFQAMTIIKIKYQITEYDKTKH